MTEREIRGISRFGLAARVKLPVERIVGLEEGREALPWDGRGRAQARALAGAVGADPDEAARRVGAGRRPSPSAPAVASRARPSLRAVIGTVALAGGVAVAGIAANRLLASTPESPTPVIYRHDYVEDLLR